MVGLMGTLRAQSVAGAPSSLGKTGWLCSGISGYRYWLAALGAAALGRTATAAGKTGYGLNVSRQRIDGGIVPASFNACCQHQLQGAGATGCGLACVLCHTFIGLNLG